MAKQREAFDEIGYWSEIKLEIIRKYAAAYSKNLTAQKSPRFHHVYVDAFAGAGVHVSRTSGEFVPGSPLNALLVQPPFKHYYFVDINKVKVQSLEEIAGQRGDVSVFHGDCNQILIDRVFPCVRYDRYERALCLLDPYGLHLDWKVIRAAGQSKTIEIFLNFPVADINRNVLWRNPDKVASAQAARMDRYWGDSTWRQVGYRPVAGLFEEMKEKETNKAVAAAFRDRLEKVAGFQYVPEPIPMPNTKGAVVYYLYFAAHKPVAKKIVADIFKKYRERGA